MLEKSLYPQVETASLARAEIASKLGGYTLRLRRRCNKSETGSAQLRHRCGVGLGVRGLAHMQGTEALVSLNLLIVDFLSVFQRSKTFAFDAGKMDEDVLAFGVENKSESLFRIEPFDSALRHIDPPE